MVEVVIYEEKARSVKWGTFVLMGLLALIFGVLIFFYPGITAAVLVMLFGVLIIVLAFVALVMALISTGETARPTGLLLAAILGFIVGVGSLIAPQFFAAMWAVIIAVVLFAIGVANIIMALSHERLEKGQPHHWWIFLLGLLSIIFAILVMIYPLFGAVILFGYLLGAYFVIYGILSIIAGFALRSGSVVKNASQQS